MTRIRHYDKDTPFGYWLRDQDNDRLPAVCVEGGFTATDVDMVVMRRWQLKENTLQNIMYLEVKTRSGGLYYGQEKIFEAINLMRGVRTTASVKVQFYGVCSLHMSGTSPLDSDKMLWCRQPWIRQLRGGNSSPSVDGIKTEISKDTLLDILSWDVHPISLRKYKPTIKGHHGKREVTIQECTPLGFTVEKRIFKSY